MWRLIGVLLGKHPLGHALADDDYRFTAALIVVVEVSAGDERHSQRGEESRRNHAEPRQRVFFVSTFYVTLAAELQAEAVGARVTPRDCSAHRDAVHTRQLR